MLLLSDISFEYSATAAQQTVGVLQNVSLSIPSGAIASIAGPSGCGKTTLLNVVAGILQPTAGTLVCPELIVNGKRRVGYVFQTPSLIPWRSIRENALLGAEIASARTDELAKTCEELLSAYGLCGFQGAFPTSVSTGMQQRVSMIRAALSGAKVILLDEPFSNSDFVVRRELQRDLFRLVQERQLTAVVVTHDIEEAVRIGDTVIVLTPRPAQVAAVIRVDIARDERFSNDCEVLRHLANCTEEVEKAFVRACSEGSRP
ncbi:MAG TPA: ATP-binding cassette domain-containing protein [Phycisphaerae bacterium]|nr:ATP-binding cassette domain-containing protein [Phycisphaerae bacterium]